MGRLIAGFLVGGLLGGLAGFAIGIFVYPYIFLADIVAAEKLQDAEARTLVATGAFIHANTNDPIHHGAGKVSVYRDAVHLAADFEVGPGPRFHVYLVPQAEVSADTAVDELAFVDLGRLRAFKGSQVYPIPAGIDPADYGSVVIWCAEFGVLVSPARLFPAASG